MTPNTPSLEPVSDAVPSRDEVAQICTELLDTSEKAGPQLRQKAAFMLMRLYAAPVPPVPSSLGVKVEEGRMSDDMNVFDWLQIELSAIDLIYRGDPTYEHDAYWLRDRVERLIEDARKAFPEVTTPEKTASGEVVVTDEMVEAAHAVIEKSFETEPWEFGPPSLVARLALTAALKSGRPHP